jgi:large subunit ribosomal protein L30
MSKANKITLTMQRSTIATNPNQKDNLRGLGLRRRGDQVVLNDTAATRGMIRKVIHLVHVEKGDTSVKKEKKSFFEVSEPKADKKTAAKKTTKKAAAKKTADKK